MWTHFVELVRVTIFSVAHVCGGSLGTAIVLVSALVRLALMPLTLRVMRQSRANAQTMASLKPQLDALSARYANDPMRLLQETRAVQRAHGVSLFTPTALVSLLVQAPLLSGLFAAVRSGLGARVRFAFIRDLGAPSLPLLGIALALTWWGAASASAGSTGTRTPNGAALMSVLLTLAFLWSASSAVVLSYGAGSLVTLLQNWILSRDHRGAVASPAVVR